MKDFLIALYAVITIGSLCFVLILFTILGVTRKEWDKNE
jgi:hypothetical protein